MADNMTQTKSVPLAQRTVAPKRKVADHIAKGAIYAAIVVALIPLLWLLITVIMKGGPVVADFGWWIYDLTGVAMNRAGGGVGHAIVGTLTQVLITSLISIPIGIFTAIYLVEYDRGGRLGKITTFMVDILSGVPSIVAALFVYALWITAFGFQRSGFAVSLALVLLMVPVIVRNAEEMLRIVPQDLREASYALGVPKWKTIYKVVLPTALSGLMTGIMLAVARVIGESAPVLILVGATQSVQWDPLSGNQSSLPLFMLQMYRLGSDEYVLQRLWGAALTLIIIIAVLMLAARWISWNFAPKKF